MESTRQSEQVLKKNRTPHVSALDSLGHTQDSAWASQSDRPSPLLPDLSLSMPDLSCSSSVPCNSLLYALYLFISTND